MKKTIEQANNAVETVESRLTELDKLTVESIAIQGELADLDKNEAEVLASAEKEQSKLKQLLSLRATRDIKTASLAGLKADIENVEAATIQAGIDTSNPFGTLRDELIALRQDEALSILAEVLPVQAYNEAVRLSKQREKSS
jgi:hypothetical protein